MKDKSEHNQEQEHAKTMHVKEGVKTSHDGTGAVKQRRFKKKATSIDIPAFAAEITGGSRRALAKGITLIESTNALHRKQAQQLLQETVKEPANSIRIGISGVPGAGKSTFIEQFGMMLTQKGWKVAVLAIDPSSTVTGGSVLGDKTRMEELSRHPNAFIRPSPASGTLGGVHRKTRETMYLCEAAGYDIILVETVGVGQSEVAVRNMVDFFMLLVLTGAGDDLQGMKKGIMEMADLIVVHKADGENLRNAKRTVREYKRILHFLQPATPAWQAGALSVSSLTSTGHEQVWEQVLDFQKEMQASGYWLERRESQLQHWFNEAIEARLLDRFFNQKDNKQRLDYLEEQILSGDLTVGAALDQLFSKDEGM